MDRVFFRWVWIGIVVVCLSCSCFGTIPFNCTTMFDSHCYEAFIGTPTNWSTAVMNCKANGGYLVTVTSSQEQSTVNEIAPPTQNFWIGLSDLQTTQIWNWITGETFNFTSWLPTFPDNDTTMNCVKENPAGDWANEDCGVILDYVCEYENNTSAPTTGLTTAASVAITTSVTTAPPDQASGILPPYVIIASVIVPIALALLCAGVCAVFGFVRIQKKKAFKNSRIT